MVQFINIVALKKGDRIYWEYLHHLNRKSTILKRKQGIFIRSIKHRKNQRPMCWVLFDQNECNSRVPFDEVIKEGGEMKNSETNRLLILMRIIRKHGKEAGIGLLHSKLAAKEILETFPQIKIPVMINEYVPEDMVYLVSDKYRKEFLS